MMDWKKHLSCIGMIALALASPLTAQQGDDEGSSEDEDSATAEPIEDVIVVTASRFEQPIHEVPAAITVLSSEAIEAIPADNFGDYLRNIPGVNVSQMSARDIQVMTRGAAFSLTDSQLVLMDNRTLYLDFFGFVMWDFVPLDPREIKQMEVVRGPGSAVWGANAMNGVINLITKSPSEMQGTSVTLGGGNFDTYYGSVTHAGVSGKLGYKVTGAYYQQGEAYDRPTGTIPGSAGPTNPGGTPYPDYDNQGTEQPKFNLRFDYDQTTDTAWSFEGGYGGTDGIMHSGIGPFDINSGTNMTYVKADWMHRATRATFFINLLDGDAVNLLTRGLDGEPISFDFESETYNFDISDTRVLGTNHVVTWGANARRNDFDLSIAPRGDKRNEYGIFVQDEILIGDHVRWLIGARWDDIDPIDSVVSPRTSLLLSPKPNHTFRLSYNRAFRAPSMINNYLEIVLVNQIQLPFVGQYIFPTLAVGNENLDEEQLDAFEVGYVGTFGKTNFTLSVYSN
jgi:iron complex outermembrane receptor protein